MIQIDSISKKFKTKSLFSDLSLAVSSSEVCGLVGLNGVGKTTLIRIICGTLKPDSGSVVTLGEQPGKNGAFYRRIGVVLDSDGFNGNLTFIDNMSFFAKIKKLPKQTVQEYVDKYWKHLATKAIPVKQFSRGERMQCSLARAFLGNPEILLLDEPASNLDSEGYELLCTLVRDSQANGAATLISSHRLDAISDLCENVAFLSQGGLVKRSLVDENGVEWILRGQLLQKAIPYIEEYNGAVISSSGYEIRFNNISKDQVSEIVPKIVSNGVVLWELFMNDRVKSVMETL